MGTLPARTVHSAAINLEIDLNSAWMPFNPTISAQYSGSTSALITDTALKIPYLPGTREIYTYRVILDCLGQDTPIEKKRRGVLYIDRAPEKVWKDGGAYKGE